MKAKDLKDTFQYLLAAVIMVGFFTVLIIVFTKAVPQDNKDVAYLIVGALVTIAATVVNYFFSSTKGSAEKTDIISKLPPVEKEETNT